MQVEFLAENVDKFLSLLTKTVSSHSPVPVLSNFLLEATASGLTISSTDLEMGATIKVAAKVIEEGGVTIPGKQFAEVMGSLGLGPVVLTEEKNSLILTSRNNRVVFQTISKDEFPSLFAERGEKIYSFKKSEFQSIFSKLTFVVSTEESRPALTGVYLHQQDKTLNVVATDGFRLSLKTLSNAQVFENGEGLIISARLINEALTLKEGETIDMYYYENGNQVLFETENVVLVGRSIEGEFPNYGRVIPSSHTTTAIVDHDEFLRLIRLAGVLARDSANIVRLSVKENMLSLYSKSSGVGEADTRMDIILEGDSNEISFNIKYLLDFLRVVNEKNIIMELSASDAPALFRVENDPSYLHVIMPIRV